MRFPQVSIGQRFTFQGRHYIKTGPLTASEEITGAQRLISKAAEVTLLDSGGKPVKELKQRYNRAELTRRLIRFKGDLVYRLQEMAEQDGTLKLKQVVALIESLEP